MKKILISIAALFYCFTSNGQYTVKSLNGYSEMNSLQMIQHFKDINIPPTTQLNVNIWFRKDVIIAMSALLKKEKADRVAKGLPATDGIRIYFAGDLITNKMSVIIVSTYDTQVPNPKKPGKNYHEDYYEHLANDNLFQIDQLFLPGVPQYNSAGASLYVTSGLPEDPSCANETSIPHYIPRATGELMAQNFGKHKVNTTGEFFDIDLINSIAAELNNYDKADGIRIYFARHPWNDQNETEKDAFVIVTTNQLDASDPKQDYFQCRTPALKNKQNGKQGSLNSLSLSSNGINNTMVLLKSGSDNGELCPDNCNIP